MPWPKTIVVASDLSEASSNALALAGRLARQVGADVILGSCFDPNPLMPVVAAAGGGQRLGRLMDEQEAAIRERLEVERQTHLGGLECTTVILRESATALAVAKLAERREAELLVVGSHGRTGMSRALLGSVAEGVVRQAHCPVLVAR